MASPRMELSAYVCAMFHMMTKSYARDKQHGTLGILTLAYIQGTSAMGERRMVS